MTDLKDILGKMNKPTQTEIKTQDWQFEAIEAIKKMKDGAQNRGGIFKCFKTDKHRAKIALSDCSELGKPFSKYFFKVFSEIKKKTIS